MDHVGVVVDDLEAAVAATHSAATHGRPPWRRGSYRYAAWDNDFDNVLQRIAVQDRDLAPSKRRVLVAEDEPGKDWAEACIGSSIPEHMAAVDTAKSILESGYTLGLEQKLASAATEEERLRVVLRDVKNHSQAFIDSRADQVVVLAQEAPSYLQAVAGVAAGRLGGSVEQKRLPEIIGLLQQILRPRNFAELKDFA